MWRCSCVITGNSSYCNFIENITQRAYCKALLTNDEKWCENVTIAFRERVDCYMKMALVKGELSICEKVREKMKNWCEYSRECNKTTVDEMEEICRAIAKRDLKKIRDLGIWESPSIRSFLQVIIGDPSLCEDEAWCLIDIELARANFLYELWRQMY